MEVCSHINTVVGFMKENWELRLTSVVGKYIFVSVATALS